MGKGPGQMTNFAQRWERYESHRSQNDERRLQRAPFETCHRTHRLPSE